MHETSGYTLSRDEIIGFAEQFDPQPFHVDEEAAEESIFGGIIASGLHTLCLSVRLYTEDFFQREQELAIMGGWGMDELRFHDPVYPGETLRVEVEVADKDSSQSRPDRGYADLRVRTTTGERQVMSVTVHIIVRRREDATGSE